MLGNFVYSNPTRLYFGESLPNPRLNVFPIREVADIGRALGIPLSVLAARIEAKMRRKRP